MPHHNFSRFLDAIEKLKPAQIENAQTKIQHLRQSTEAISEIEGTSCRLERQSIKERLNRSPENAVAQTKGENSVQKVQSQAPDCVSSHLHLVVAWHVWSAIGKFPIEMS